MASIPASSRGGARLLHPVPTALQGSVSFSHTGNGSFYSEGFVRSNEKTHAKAIVTAVIWQKRVCVCMTVICREPPVLLPKANPSI